MNKHELDNLSINTIRFLAVDAIQKANSGHPGMPMGCAPLAYILFTEVMNHNPKNAKWYNRDRFVLSAGHGSMLLYSLLHLSGYKVSLDELKNFRQYKSITPGHPEFGLADGVETTTGPLGQGFANACGMALANKFMSAKFNKTDIQIIDNWVYAIAGDGDLMEGVSHEAASFAGHNKLGKLIVFYDNNKITIDGSTELSMSDDARKRFESYGWSVSHINDVNNLEEVRTAVKKAKENSTQPHLVITNTTIGYGSPNKQGTSSVHGAPLGEAEVKLAKENLKFPPDKTFYIPDAVKENFSSLKEIGTKKEEEWNSLFKKYQEKYHDDVELLSSIINDKVDTAWEKHLHKFENYGEKIATRSASNKVINSFAKFFPALLSGSADLDASTLTDIKDEKKFSNENPIGRNIAYGIREHGMGSIMNGISLYGGLRAVGSTFLIFSEYMRPPIRLAALMEINPIYVFTHDSVGLGEDGPTHQPVEQLASLRAIPHLVVLRPSDANEVTEAWRLALKEKKRPVAIALTRQKISIIDRTKYASANDTDKGAYIIKDCAGTPELILIATGSEVEIALDSAEKLESDGIKTRVVSMPSWELFDEQSDNYKESILPESVKNRISIEAGVGQGWQKYVGDKGKIISIEGFGISAPYEKIYKHFGLTVENIVKEAKSLTKS